MCGIAGYVARKGEADHRLVERQLDLLLHRGPDSLGVHRRDRAALGQTRLAIVDLVTGDPPIASEDGSVGVALNGEIYNFRELRRDLLREGHRFATQGDTEVIAHLAEGREPPDVAAMLDGMFAFAWWNEPAGRLVLARDRFGKKPLYYWDGPDAFVFGSEIKAVLAHPAVPARLHEPAVEAYVQFGYVPTPQTFFEGIRSVPPGHVLVMTADGAVEVTPYWSPPAGRVARLSSSVSAEAPRLLRQLLEESVERRLVADVPLGAFLSGGVDSSAIVALMAQLGVQPLRTFTMGFIEDEGHDERLYARKIAQRYGTDHHEFVVKPDAVDLVERLVWHHDQPFGDSSAIPMFLLAEMTRKEVTVALSGDGGDELFAGYERFAAALAVQSLERVPGSIRRVGLRAGRGLTGALRLESAHRLLLEAPDGLPDAYLAWVSFVPPRVLRRLMPQATGWAHAHHADIWAASGGLGTLDRLQDLNLRTYLVDDLLPKSDRMSMAHGLEVRSPFLDPRLADFAFSLPASARLRGWSFKRVLREAVADLVPREILTRRKHGFGVPLDRWFRTSLSGYVDGMLGTPHARVRAFVEPEQLDLLLRQHGAGASRHGHVLWTLLTLEVFLRGRGW